MMNLIVTLVVFIAVLAFIFGILSSATGDESKGNPIIMNCITAMVLYLIILQLFNTGLPENTVFDAGLPLVNNIEKFGSVREYFLKEPGLFALDFVELVSLTVLINWVSNTFSVGGSGIAGRFTARLVIVLGGVIVYGLFMNFVRENVIMKWCVYAVECIITGGSIVYTPVMLVTALIGVKEGNMIPTYIVQQFSHTALSRSISNAITSSVMFLALLVVIESQYGSVCSVLQGAVDAMESIGATVIAIMGLYIIVKSFGKRG